VSSTSADTTDCCSTDAARRAEMHPPKAKENPPQHAITTEHGANNTYTCAGSPCKIAYRKNDI
jgi:hypothetical protein